MMPFIAWLWICFTVGGLGIVLVSHWWLDSRPWRPTRRRSREVERLAHDAHFWTDRLASDDASEVEKIVAQDMLKLIVDRARAMAITDEDIFNRRLEDAPESRQMLLRLREGWLRDITNPGGTLCKCDRCKAGRRRMLEPTTGAGFAERGQLIQPGWWSGMIVYHPSRERSSAGSCPTRGVPPRPIWSARQTSPSPQLAAPWACVSNGPGLRPGGDPDVPPKAWPGDMIFPVGPFSRRPTSDPPSTGNLLRVHCAPKPIDHPTRRNL